MPGDRVWRPSADPPDYFQRKVAEDAAEARKQLEMRQQYELRGSKSHGVLPGRKAGITSGSPTKLPPLPGAGGSKGLPVGWAAHMVRKSESQQPGAALPIMAEHMVTIVTTMNELRAQIAVQARQIEFMAACLGLEADIRQIRARAQASAPSAAGAPAAGGKGGGRRPAPLDGGEANDVAGTGEEDVVAGNRQNAMDFATHDENVDHKLSFQEARTLPSRIAPRQSLSPLTPARRLRDRPSPLSVLQPGPRARGG